MRKRRSLHLYLGCIFAPMLLFFAVSGIWQTLGLTGARFFRTLSTLHTMQRFKDGFSLESPMIRGFVLTMAVAFIITTVLGIIMAIYYGHSRKAAWTCLAFGVLLPTVLVIIGIAR